MELIHREWQGIRFSLPATWTTFVVDNGALAAGSSGEIFIVTKRSVPLEKLADEWSERLEPMGSQLLSDTHAASSHLGLLRVTAVGAIETRIVTQLFVGGNETVTATYSAPADDSYDRNQADAVIRSVRVKQARPA